jgi:7,8-dihydropterin-6-yl-methyl-4-(beta-D-ribofuranosyl)aminobenzene 5'-phosphate synthase
MYLNKNKHVKAYVPSTVQGIDPAQEVIYIDEPRDLYKHFYSTGLLKSIEQSLVVEIEQGLVVIVGCSHPGVDVILDEASQLGTPFAVIGGLDGFKEFELIKRLQFICLTHCTQCISKIRALYPDKYVRGGVGKLIEI